MHHVNDNCSRSTSWQFTVSRRQIAESWVHKWPVAKDAIQRHIQLTCFADWNALIIVVFNFIILLFSFLTFLQDCIPIWCMPSANWRRGGLWTNTSKISSCIIFLSLFCGCHIGLFHTHVQVWLSLYWSPGQWGFAFIERDLPHWRCDFIRCCVKSFEAAGRLWLLYYMPI